MGWGFIGDIAKKAGGAIRDAAEDAWESVEDTAGGLIDDIGSSVKDSAGGAWNKLEDGFGDAWGKVEDAAGDVWGKAEDAAGDVWGKAEDAAGDVWGKAEDAAGDAWGKVEGGLDDVWGKIESSAGDAWSSIGDEWSSVSDSLGGVGDDVWGGIEGLAGESGDLLGRALDGVDDYVFDSVDYLTGGTLDIDWDDGDFSIGAGIDDVFSYGVSLGDDGFGYEQSTLGAGAQLWATGDGVGLSGSGGLDYARLPYADLHLEVTDEGHIISNGELQGTLPTPVGMLGGEISGHYVRTDDGWSAGGAFAGDLTTPSGTKLSAAGGVSHAEAGDTSMTSANFGAGLSSPGTGSLGFGVDYQRLADGSIVAESTELAGYAKGLGLELNAGQRWTSLETPEGSVSESIGNFDLAGLDAESATKLGGALAEWTGLDVAGLEADPEDGGLMDQALGFFSGDGDSGDSTVMNLLGNLAGSDGDSPDDLSGMFGSLLSGGSSGDDSAGGLWSNLVEAPTSDDGGFWDGLAGTLTGTDGGDDGGGFWEKVTDDLTGGDGNGDGDSFWGGLAGTLTGTDGGDGDGDSFWGGLAGTITGGDVDSGSWGDLFGADPISDRPGFPADDTTPDGSHQSGTEDPGGIDLDLEAPGTTVFVPLDRDEGDEDGVGDDVLGTGTVPPTATDPAGTTDPTLPEPEPMPQPEPEPLPQPEPMPQPEPEPIPEPEPVPEPSFSEQIDSVQESTAGLTDTFDDDAP